jgi:hypothetical protein
MSDGFGSYAAATQQQDTSVSLDFGIETTGGLAGQKAPEGLHTWEVTGLEPKYTTNGELALVLTLTIVSSAVHGAVGITNEEWLVIPGDTRKLNDPDKWQMMMRMTRMKLEAITGRPWRDNNMSLKASELLHRRFVASVTHSETKVEADGETKTYINVNLNNWQAVQAQAAQQAFAQPAPAQQPAPLTQPAGGPHLAQQQPPQQPQPQQQMPAQNGPGFAFGDQAQQQPVSTQQQPPNNQVYDPAEEPF